MSTLSLSFPDSTYTTSNKPSTNTVKADFAAIELGHNAHEADLANPHSVTAAQVGALKTADLDTDGTLAANSDTVVASQKAVKTYADTKTTLATVLAAIYPVGSIYTNAGVATNPATLFGFGTWSAFGAGRVIVGLDAGQTEFDVLEETGGAKTHTLTEAELAVHTHVQNAHSHMVPCRDNDDAGTNACPRGTDAGVEFSTKTTTATNQNTGSGTAHNNLQPYIVAYVWKRTA